MHHPAITLSMLLRQQVLLAFAFLLFAHAAFAAETRGVKRVEIKTEVAAYEPEEDEKVTAAVIKKALKELIDDLGGSFGESATRQRYFRWRVR